MLNVLLIPVNDLLSHPIETRFIFIARKMMEKYDVNFFMLRYTNIPTATNVDRKLKIKPVAYKDLRLENLGLYYVFNAVPIFFKLANQLKHEKIDIIIHANILPSTIAVKLGRMFHKPLIYDFQDYFPESAACYFNGRVLRSMTYAITSQLTRFNIKHSNAIVTVTDAHKKEVEKYDPSKLVEVIPNGVDTDIFKPIPRSEALQKLGIAELEGKVILTYFGSIDPWLDLPMVFRVMKKMVNSKYDIFLFIIGFCHSRYYMRELKDAAKNIGIEERLFILDPVPQDKLVYFINASDVILAPYKQILKNQAVPLKILESIACQKLVCVTKLSEIINRFGDIVIAYSNEEELELSLLKVLKGKVNLPVDRMKEIATTYSWNHIAYSYYDLMCRISKA